MDALSRGDFLRCRFLTTHRTARDDRHDPSGTFRSFSEDRRDVAPFFESEDLREEASRRFWDACSPPHFGFAGKPDDFWNLDSESYCLVAIQRYNAYFSKMVTNADSAAAKWSGYVNYSFTDGNSFGRQHESEVGRVGGKMDAMRLPKEAFYTYRVLQNEQPDIHILGHWTYPQGTRKNVYVVSNCDEVELFRNGVSLGKIPSRDRFFFEFRGIEWKPGMLRAVGTENGRKAAEQELETAGLPKRLKLTPITGPAGFRADGSDIALIDVEVVDEQGRRCPTDEGRVDFEISGPAVWRGGYNSGKQDSVNKRYLDTECGINRVAVRSTLKPGVVTLTAKREGLEPATVKMETRRFATHGGLTAEMPQRLPFVGGSEESSRPNAESPRHGS